jgi:hypothetical protein
MMMDEADRARPNGTSIAFIVEAEGKRVLFAADAHPNDLAAAVRNFEAGSERIYFDAIKAAHHGSAKNNTSELIAVLSSPLWLISTNGSKHGHPDPEAIARIVLAPPAHKILAFNYRTIQNRVWDDDAIKEVHSYRTKFAQEGRPLFVEIGGEEPSFA